jgi:hypothetical protein
MSFAEVECCIFVLEHRVSSNRFRLSMYVSETVHNISTRVSNITESGQKVGVAKESKFQSDWTLELCGVS